MRHAITQALWGAIGLLLGCWALGAMAFDLDSRPVTYKGQMIPGSFEATIAIRLDLSEHAGRVNGRGTLGPPFSAFEQPVTGDRPQGRCNLKLDMGNQGYIHLVGLCDETNFIGTYTIYLPDGRKKRGNLNLPAEFQEKKAEEGAAKVEEADPLVPLQRSTITTCIKRSTSCLMACPQADDSSAFLCVNRCRQKEKACKNKVRDLQRLAAPG